MLEYFGTEGIVNDEGPIPERYGAGGGAAGQLHGRDLPQDLPLDGGTYRIPPYDLEAMLIEVDLLVEWYAPHVVGVLPASGARAQYENIWRALLAPLLAERRSWTLRDVHSPNLLWLAEREGVAAHRPAGFSGLRAGAAGL